MEMIKYGNSVEDWKNVKVWSMENKENVKFLSMG
jgi:hypothetical protein